MNAITAVAPPQLAYAEMERLAADMANSGLFGFKTKQEAMSIMMIAQAEGKHPATAARDYDVINKKLAKRAEAMMRDFMEGGGKVKWNALTDEVADATFSHPQGGEVRISWDIARALQAGLSTKENWKKYPRQMLRNRTVSEGVRTVWPLATSGMYERGEVEDFTGKTIDGTAETEAASDEREKLNREVPLKAAASDMKRPPKITEPPPKSTHVQGDIYDQHAIAIELLNVGDSRTWMSNLEMLLAEATSLKAVEVIGECESVKRTIEKAPGSVRARVSELLANACKRFIENDPDHSAEELPEVEIEGERNVMAG